MAKRKSKLSRSTSEARKLKLLRRMESDSDREKRLAAARAAEALRRANETEEDRLARLSYHQRKKTESKEKRELRLNNINMRQKLLLANETDEQREARLATQRLRQKQRREKETAEERQKRLAIAKYRRAFKKAQQVKEERKERRKEKIKVYWSNWAKRRQMVSESELNRIKEDHEMSLSLAKIKKLLIKPKNKKQKNIKYEEVTQVSLENREKITSTEIKCTPDLTCLQVEEFTLPDKDEHKVE